MEYIKEATVGNKTIKIYHSEGDNPRTYDGNITRMIFFGNHEGLGDKHDIKLNEGFNSRQDFMDRGAEIVQKATKAVICLPVHLYEHSGISLSINYEGQYADRWDSGTCGFVIITKEDIRECYGIKRVTQKHIDKAVKEIEGELKELNQYINGEVYGFEITEEGEETDSCGGFYGDDFKTNGMADHVGDDKLIEAICD